MPCLHSLDPPPGRHRGQRGYICLFVNPSRTRIPARWRPDRTQALDAPHQAASSFEESSGVRVCSGPISVHGSEKRNREWREPSKQSHLPVGALQTRPGPHGRRGASGAWPECGSRAQASGQPALTHSDREWHLSFSFGNYTCVIHSRARKKMKRRPPYGKS